MAFFFISHDPAPRAASPEELRRPALTPPTRTASPRHTWRQWPARFWQWLRDAEPSPTLPLTPSGSLNRVQNEFLQALRDLQSPQVNQIRDRLICARSLRELWHLRADVFRAVAMHRGQMEAQTRLDTLDELFPVRTSRRNHEAAPRQGKVASW